MLESLFRFLFEYRPVVFQQGEFRFAPTPARTSRSRSRSSPACSSSSAIARAAPAACQPRGAGPRVLAHRHAAPLLLGLRLALIALVAFCLFRPVLVVKAAVAQQNFLAVLIDDSRSMRIDDRRRAQAAGSQVTRGEYRAAAVRRSGTAAC